MDSILRTEWVGRLVLGAGPHPNDAHGRAAPAELHALADPLALPVLAERYLTQSTNRQRQFFPLSFFFYIISIFLIGDEEDTHEGPAHVTRRGHFDRPAHAREFRRRAGGVPVARDVDRGSAGPRCRRARVMRDAQRERDDAHHFVKGRVAEALRERERLCRR